MYRASWGNAAGHAVLLLVSSSLFHQATADVSFEGSIPTRLEMGTSYNIRWSTDADNVRVTLISGSESSNNIYHLYDVICDIWVVDDLSKACTSTDDSVDWTPSDDLPIGNYMLMANAADDSTAFSSRFTLAKAGSASSSAAGGSSGTATSTSTGSLVTSTFFSSSGSTSQLVTSAFTTSAGSTGSPSNGTPNGTSDATSDATTSGGLSTGARAGIGIGAAVGGLALLGALGFLVFRMGKRAAADKKMDDESAEDGAAAAEDGKAEDSKPEGSKTAGDAAAAKADKPGEGAISELQAPEKIFEAPDYKTRLENPREFVSELDATGGSFTIPQVTTRPNTGDTTAAGSTERNTAASEVGAESRASKKENGSVASGRSERASTPIDRSMSVRYETPDDIGREADK